MPRAARYYRPELDVVRFFALLMVFNLHVFQVQALGRFPFLTGIQQAGAAGVCMFFTLSSFLITELLMREREASGTISIPSFYARRALRIWPLYLLAMALALLGSVLIGHVFAPVGFMLLPFLVAMGNWAVVAHGWFLNPMLTPMWSISVEEQFYLIWPYLSLRVRPRTLFGISASLLPLAWLVDWLLPLLHFHKSPQLWCNSLNQFQFFAIGCMAAILFHRRPVHLSTAARLATFGLALCLFYLAARPFQFLNDDIPTGPGAILAGYLCIDAGCFLVLLAFLNARMPRLARPLIYLGKISYGLYVFHFAVRTVVWAVVARPLRHLLPTPVRQLVATYLITAAVTAALASLSYRFYERPFLRMKKRFTLVRSRAA
ncbi:acyltransferase [Acidipila sp. EB88]|uniref:acyltransferase family protein n=1 Tax=Acidipila sp. EB88 TaxID=2305226 RepID=UPI000F5F377A|nr:acyltransferase [Acidipila sp. EB88]RRA48948.1 acyltransferase [Acidipila sp. EB88]